MTDRALVLELLEDIKPRGYCDDCLSLELDIQPRQTINQVCRTLRAAKSIERTKAICDRCGKAKITNLRSGAVETGSMLKHRTLTGSSIPVDIEKARTEVVQICRELWRKTQPDAPSHSISANIATLKNKGTLPTHQANMMLTLCGLRNVHIYDGLALGDRELLIARYAQEIVLEWWKEAQARVTK